MTSRLDAMRAKLAEQKKRQDEGGGNAVARREYPHWKIDFDETVSLRYLPDADETNDYFWRKKLMYDWKFASPDTPGETVRIIMPCRNMYDGYTGDKACPVRKKLSAMFDAKGEQEEAAKPFWVTTSYLYSGFVRRSPYNEPAVPENPIRIFDLSKKLHEYIEGSILVDDPDRKLAYDPVDYENGLNFIIEKKRNAKGYADYTNSQWSKNPTPLSEEEKAAIKQWGLVNLKEELPAKPSDEAFSIQMSMLEAALANEPWNPEWEAHFKPFKNKARDGASATAKPKLDIPEDTDTGSSEPPQISAKANDVLARIRTMSNKTASAE